MWDLSGLEKWWYNKNYNEPDELIRKKEFIEVEEDPGDVTEDEDTNNADEDEGEVDFYADWAFGSQMRKSGKNKNLVHIIFSLDQNYCQLQNKCKSKSFWSRCACVRHR